MTLQIGTTTTAVGQLRGIHPAALPARASAHARRILCLSNARSGKGRGAAVSASFAAQLQDLGHRVTQLDVKDAATQLTQSLENSDLLVIFGGDGTVHHALPALVESAVPFYHVGQGTENLLTRQFRMRPTLLALRQAIDAWNVKTADIGEFNSTPFAIMASVGPDASTLHRLHAVRKGAISHLSYVKPAILEVLRPNIPTLTIHADGRPVVRNQQGLAVVASCPQYATRLNPAHNADIHDGLLDLVFLPATTSIATALWAPRAWLRRIQRQPAAITARAAHFRITETHTDTESDSPTKGSTQRPSRAYLQIDGEAILNPTPNNPNNPARPPYDFTVKPAALKVLCPPDNNNQHTSQTPNPADVGHAKQN